MFLSGEPFRRRDLSQHAAKQASRQVALCKQQPRLQARERPVVDSLRQHQPPPQVAQVVGQHAQPESYLIGPEMMAAQPRHLHRLLAFFDPLASESN